MRERDHGSGRASRRRALAGMAAALALPAVWRPRPAAPAEEARSLSLYNTNTGESFAGEYFRDGDYLADAGAELDRFMRDHNADVFTAMDPGLFDLLWRLAERYRVAHGHQVTINVNSGYRTMATDRSLMTEGWEQTSMHQAGRAADITVQGYGIYILVNQVQHIGAGGIGLYWGPKFVHVDTGPRRYWYYMY